MKRVLFTIVFLSAFYANAQTTIIEEKFEKDNIPLDYDFLEKENAILIQKGKYAGMSTNKMVNTLIKYDASGKKEVLLENDESMKVFSSPSGKTLKLVKYEAMSYEGKKYKFLANGKPTALYDLRESLANLNDVYEFGFVNQKGKSDIEYEKDDLVLSLTNIATRKNSKITLQKPEISRLKGDQFYISSRRDVGFNVRNDSNDQFEIITKSINKECTVNTIYRTFYDFTGKKLKEQSYVIDVAPYSFVSSLNEGGKIGFPPIANAKNIAFLDDLSVNNFIVDKDQNVYFYGLLGKEGKKDALYATISGCYVVKFDSQGKKLWQYMKKIEDKVLEDIDNKVNISTSLAEIGDKLTFKMASFRHEQIVVAVNLDRTTGSELKFNKQDFKVKGEFNVFTGPKDFLSEHLTNKAYGKNRIFDYEGLVELENNKAFSAYVKGITGKEKIFFGSYYMNGKLWLMESDNKTYYKVTVF